MWPNIKNTFAWPKFTDFHPQFSVWNSVCTRIVLHQRELKLQHSWNVSYFQIKMWYRNKKWGPPNSKDIKHVYKTIPIANMFMVWTSLWYMTGIPRNILTDKGLVYYYEREKMSTLYFWKRLRCHNLQLLNNKLQSHKFIYLSIQSRRAISVRRPEVATARRKCIKGLASNTPHHTVHVR